MAEVDFNLNKAGLREIFKGEGMQDALREASNGLAGKANSAARASASHNLSRDPYNAYVRVLGGTAIGGVSTSGTEAERHEAMHHSLSSVNH